VDITIAIPGGTSATSAADRFSYLGTPTITAVSPAISPLTGKTVTITGTNLSGATAVLFGSVAATSVSVNATGTQITATAPPALAGSVDITVTAPGGSSAITPADRFTYMDIPAITGVSPNAGPLAAGTVVMITGTGLEGATSVRFGAVAATNVAVNAAGTQITATAPAGQQGPVDVTVISPGGTSAASLADRFTYVAPPVVSSFDLNLAPLTGRTSVTIMGSNLTGATEVMFGSNPATNVTVNSAGTQITATVPAGSAGTVDVTVTTPGGTSALSSSDRFTYTSGPVVTGISPNSGPVAAGTAVTISGFNLAHATSVKFGSKSATKVTVNSAGTQISAKVPAGSPGSVAVTVTTPNGTSPGLAAASFTYATAPTVSGMSPAVGPLAAGTSVTITGKNLGGATVVQFGTQPALSFTVNDTGTQITAIAPAGAAAAVDVTVTTPAGTSAKAAADKFTYMATPTITALSVTTGPTTGGTLVTIIGTNLKGATAVRFGVSLADNFTVNAAGTHITVHAPQNSPGVADVVVTAPGGTSATVPADRFTYVQPPIITSITPSAGPVAGGTIVTITGTSLIGATAVHFGTKPGTRMTVNPAGTQITVTAPAEVAGSVDVVVLAPTGTSPVTANDKFTYVAKPTVAVVSPNSGSTAGGTLVTISGTHLTGAAVKFGTILATNVQVNATGSQLTAISPAGSVGIVDVTVTTLGGTAATLTADRFTYERGLNNASIGPVAHSTAAGPLTSGATLTAKQGGSNSVSSFEALDDDGTDGVAG
jgi:hypothetical protein